MFAHVKMQIVAATCLLSVVCAIHDAVDRQTENRHGSSDELAERSRRSVSRPYPYGHHYNPIEPPPWNDVAEHVPDSRIDAYKPAYWPFVRAVADKLLPPPPSPPPDAYRRTGGSVYVPVFDAADFGRSPWHAPPPHRLAPEDDREGYHRAHAEPKAAVRVLANAGTQPATFDGQQPPAVVVFTMPVDAVATGKNATAAGDDGGGALLLLVDGELLEHVADPRQTDARPPAYLTVDNISAEFPSDGSLSPVDEYDNNVA